MELRSKDVVIPAIVGFASFLVGIGVGYAISKRAGTRTAIKYIVPEVGDSEVEGGEHHSEARESEDDQPELPFAPGGTYEIDPETRTVVVLSPPEPELIDGATVVYYKREDDDDDWDYDVELENRSDKRPYVIHVDEYTSHESDYPQETITYYEGDDVLCDEKDVPIYTRERITGPLLFGHGSQDPNIVYIRNDKIEMEWEVLRDEGHFVAEVLGAEMEHSVSKKKGKQHPKFRLE